MEDFDQAGLAAREAVGAELDVIYTGLGEGVERAAALQQLGRLALAAGLNERAEGLLRESTEREPGTAAAWFERGLACLFLGREEEALQFLSKAMAMEDGLPEAAFRRAQALQGLGLHKEALEWYQKVGVDSRHWGKARQNEALIALQHGDYELGWKAYEHRWDENPAMQRRVFESPLWLGKEDLQGKTLLVHAEQGLGDTLQFLRYTLLLRGLGAYVCLEVQAPLKRLVQGGDFAHQTLVFGEPLPAHDFHCPLCSLALAFWRLGVRAIPTAPRYLRAVGGGEEALRRLRLASGILRVGVAWLGNPRNPRNRQRSIPLERFNTLLLTEGCHFYGLQLRPEIPHECVPAARGFTDLAPYIYDFADMAAVLEELDLVICVDTALAHLAGALGRPAWVLLAKEADWRWGLAGEESEWYPRARLFRQEKHGDWAGLLARVRDLLLQRRAQLPC